MDIGINIRIMGQQSAPEVMSSLMRSAEDVGVESVWVVDHIAIPPDDIEGSGGRYFDPLTVLAWMSAQSKKIKLATGILVLPYRSRLPTAKAIASIQELSGGRLILGVGIGWMEPEFKALGVPIDRRAEIAEDTLSFINDCFDRDVMESNGQPFIFEPKPKKPTIFVGGMSSKAIRRAVEFNAGWFPMGRLENIRGRIADFRQRALAHSGRIPEVVTYVNISEKTDNELDKIIDEYRDAGITRIVLNQKYQAVDDWLRTFESLDRRSSY